MIKPITNQKPRPVPVVEMDAGKFLHLINAGAQSQHVLFSERIQKMGEAAGTAWRLVSLDKDILVFEDVEKQTYNVADIKKLAKGRVQIENIRELKIVESKKENSFRKNLSELVDAICEDDSGKADAIFNRIAAQRFRSSVIPENGLVTTRDGVTRFVSVSTTVVEEGLKPRIVKAICEALGERVKIQRGRIVEAVFGDATIKFPVNELVRRKVIARYMKSVAESAYVHEGFQNRVEHVASLVCEDKITEATRISAEFLREEEEFSLLTLAEMRKLVGNALATKGVMSNPIAEDVGEMFYTVNCTVNRTTILESWHATARKSEYAPLVENVRRLGESTNFNKDYEAFLKAMFVEDMTTKAAKAKMYLSALKDMKNVLTGSQADQELVGSLDGYIVRLETAGEDVDDATLMEVEELVASTSENLLNDVSGLHDFDTIPEPAQGGADAFGSKDLGAANANSGIGGGGGPNLPLGEEDLAGAGGMSTPGAAPGGAPGAGAGAAPGAGAGAAPGAGGAPGAGAGKPGMAPRGKTPQNDDEAVLAGLAPESRNNDGSVIAEEDEKCEKCNKTECECDEETDECMESESFDKLGAKELALELAEWQKNGEKFFSEDGFDSASDHLKLCISRAKALNEANLYNGFKQILAENTPVDTTEADRYQYQATNAKINKNYGVKEEHETWSKKMKEGDGKSASEGGKTPPKGDAMGEAGESEMNVSPDGHADAKLKKTSQKKIENESTGDVTCPECKGGFEATECMTESGAKCPDCNADMSKQLMEALNIDENLADKGHKMDRIEGGKGVVDNGLAKADGRKGDGAKGGSGTHRMERIGGGKGVAGESPKETEGTAGHAGKGKKEAMDGQEGKGVAENQFKTPTHRRKGGMKRSAINKFEEGKGGKKNPIEALAEGVPEDISEETTVTVSSVEQGGNSTDERTVTYTTDEPVDQVVSKIGDAITPMDGEEGMEGMPGEGEEGIPGEEAGDDVMPPGEEETAMPGEGDGMPGEGEEGLEGLDNLEGGEEGMPGEGGETMEAPGGEMPGEGGEEIPGEGGGEAPPFEGGEEEETEELPPEEEEEKPFGEGKMPAEIRKHFEKKRGGKGDESSEHEEPEHEEHEDGDDDDDGDDDGENKPPFKEDNDITAPTTKTYNSAEAARKDGGETSAGKAGSGKPFNPKPKFSTTDVDGGSTTGKPARSVGGKKK